MKPFASAQRKNVARGASIPAGSGGWNVRDPYDQMKPEDAVILDNWFPEPGRCRLRRGYTLQSSGLGDTVETLLEWKGPTSNKLLGFANENVWDCSTAAAAATSLYSTAITLNRWQGLNYGDRLLLWNGTDAPLNFDGTTVATTAWSGPASINNLITACVYRNRIYAVEKNTMSVWYGGVAAITGAMTEFDLSQIASYGGSLLFVTTWSASTGTGPQEFMVFVFTTGEILVYQGANPADATWTIVSRFKVGAPLSIRSYTHFGTELVIATEDGVLAFSQLLVSGVATEKSKISSKIGKAITDIVAAYGARFGWQLVFYPRNNMLLANVPTGAAAYQFVMNTITLAWCRFLGQDANCFETFADNLYWGDMVGNVYRADTGEDDNDTNIDGEMKTAFTHLGARGVLKRFTMIRPIILASGSVSPSIEIDADFEHTGLTAAATSGTTSGATWDIDPWDTSDWGLGEQLQREWTGVTGLGYWAAVHMKVSTKTLQVAVQSFDVLYETGGFI